jgi:hypothetical protein
LFLHQKRRKNPFLKSSSVLLILKFSQNYWFNIHSIEVVALDGFGL